MIYKKDWCVGWNDYYQIAVLCVERIPVHIWLFSYIITLPQYILHFIPVFSLDFIVKPLYSKYKRSFRFHKSGNVVKSGTAVVISGVKKIFRDIFHALFYPIRELNLWLNSKQYRFTDWGEWFYWSKVQSREAKMEKHIISVNIPFSIEKAKALFPIEYENFNYHHTDIQYAGNKNALKRYMNDSDNLFDDYIARMEVSEIKSNLAETTWMKTKATLMSCETCSRDKEYILGKYICEYGIDSECGITEFPLWKGL